MSQASPPESAAVEEGVLVVHHQQVDSAFYTEGALAFVEIQDGAGRLVADAETPDYHLDREVLRTELRGGTYTLNTFVRPCEAACPAMDPPTDGCSIEFAVETGRTTRVVIERRVGRACLASIVDP